MVTAGIYLLIRFHFLITSRGISNFLLVLGSGTIILASLRALQETDLKKVIALSTLRQLGFIVIRLGLGQVYLAFFHLLTHASFKALLFMCSGDFIHCSLGEQDMRFSGGASLGLRFSSRLLVIRNLCLCGIPYLSGFYSKEAIVEAGYRGGSRRFYFVFRLIGVFLTGFYSIRLIYLALLTEFLQPPFHCSVEPCSDIFFSKL